MQPASMKTPAGQEEEEEAPTVIWLFDSEEGSTGDADGQDSADEAPADDEKGADDGKAEPEGDVDAGEESLGQPM
jgi:hypothetical protein